MGAGFKNEKDGERNRRKKEKEKIQKTIGEEYIFPMPLFCLADVGGYGRYQLYYSQKNK